MLAHEEAGAGEGEVEVDVLGLGVGDVDRGARASGSGDGAEGAREEVREVVRAVVLDGEGVCGAADVGDAVGRVGPDAVGEVAVERVEDGGGVGGVADEEGGLA